MENEFERSQPAAVQPVEVRQPQEVKPKRQGPPKLDQYLNGPAPEGLKYNRQFVEKRNERKTIMLPKTLAKQVELVSEEYGYSQNSFVIAVLTRFMEMNRAYVERIMREDQED